MLRRIEDVCWRALFDDEPMVDEDDAIGDLSRKSHLVGHHHHRHALFGQRLHDGEHLTNGLWVERRSGLIEKHHPRLHRKSPSNGHALVLATRQLAWVNVRLVGQADLVQ